ncbi:unnamed protein product, partial [Sphacelaria rigidula]
MICPNRETLISPRPRDGVDQDQLRRKDFIASKCAQLASYYICLVATVLQSLDRSKMCSCCVASGNACDLSRAGEKRDSARTHDVNMVYSRSVRHAQKSPALVQYSQGSPLPSCPRHGWFDRDLLSASE